MYKTWKNITTQHHKQKPSFWYLAGVILYRVSRKICNTLMIINRKRSLLYKIMGKYHYTIDLLKTGLDMVIVDIDKNFFIIQLGQLYER